MVHSCKLQINTGVNVFLIPHWCKKYKVFGVIIFDQITIANPLTVVEFTYSCKTSWAYQSQRSSGQKESNQSQVSEKQSMWVLTLWETSTLLLSTFLFSFRQAHRPHSYHGNLNCTSATAQGWPGSAPADIRHSSHPASSHASQETQCGCWSPPGHRYK